MVKRKSKNNKRKSTTPHGVAVYQILGLSLILSLVWALLDTSNIYAVLASSVFGLSLSVHSLQAGPSVWKDYVKKYKKKKGTAELFFAPSKTIYYFQMYFLFPAVGIICFLGILLSVKLLLS